MIITQAEWEFGQAMKAYSEGLISKEYMDKLAVDLGPLILEELSNDLFKRLQVGVDK
jgi:hypothetical protein